MPATLDRTAPASLGLSVAGDPLDPAGYSGVPAALVDAIEQLGVSVRPLRAELPPRLQRAALNALAVGLVRPSEIPAADGPLAMRARLTVRAAKPRVHAGGAMFALRSAAVRRSLAHGGEVAGCIQFGSEYRLPRSTPYVTYDDATIVQLSREYPYPWMQAVPGARLRRMIARQRAVMGGAERCCVTNHWARASVIEDYGVDPARVVVTGQGAVPGASDTRRDWAAPRFLFVGVDWERKNGPAVLRAFAAVRDHRPDARLDLVGGHPPIDAPGVTAHGSLPLGDADARGRLHRLFATATCLVLPSLLEPSAVAFAEALQAGLPAIVGTRGGSQTIVGDAGIAVDPTDDSALTAAMLELCDARVVGRYADAARARAPLFTWRAVAERVLRAVALPGVEVSGFAEPL